MSQEFWLGSIAHGCFMTQEIQQRMPGITKLGMKFHDFQNGQWRGEWNQNLSINAGELRDALAEIALLIKYIENINAIIKIGEEPVELENDQHPQQ